MSEFSFASVEPLSRRSIIYVSCVTLPPANETSSHLESFSRTIDFPRFSCTITPTVTQLQRVAVSRSKPVTKNSHLKIEQNGKEISKTNQNSGSGW